MVSIDLENKKRNKIREEEATRQKEEMQRINTAKELFEAAKSDLAAKYGDCTKEIGFGQSDEFKLPMFIFVYEQSKIIVLNGRGYRFADILGYSLIDDATNETYTDSECMENTSTGSMLKRAGAGAILAGGFGAVAGAATAKKNITGGATSHTITWHYYKIYVNVNDLQQPTIVLGLGHNETQAHEIAGILNVIIERNKAK